MSVPSPMCPQCGQWMAPTDLWDEEHKEIVGTCWKCECGFQMPLYRSGYWERLEAEEEARERAERDAFLASFPDEFRLHARSEGGLWVAIGVYSDREDALEAAKSLGRDWYVDRWVYNPATWEYERWSTVAEGAGA